MLLDVLKPNEITKEKFDDIYVGRRIAVYCVTEELANEFLKKADEFGYEWNSGDKYTDRNYYHISNVCYCICKGVYSGKQEYLNRGYEIVTFKGFK